MKKTAIVAATFVAMAFLLGCGADAGPYSSPTMLESSELQIISELKYGKDRYGICYAMYKPGYQTGFFTEVPCEKVGL